MTSLEQHSYSAITEFFPLTNIVSQYYSGRMESGKPSAKNDIPHPGGTAPAPKLNCPHCGVSLVIDVNQFDTGSLALCPECQKKGEVYWTKSGAVHIKACNDPSCNDISKPTDEMNLLWTLVALAVAYIVTREYLDEVCKWLKLDYKKYHTVYWLLMFAITWVAGVVIHRLFREVFFFITLMAVLKFVSTLL